MQITHNHVVISVLAILIALGGSWLLFGRDDEQPQPPRAASSSAQGVEDTVPAYLQATFTSTDWSKADPSIAKAVSGGPGKDGIPAIDKPSFTSLDGFDYSDDIQAVVVTDGDSHKVYPYNILTWHEIVNDTVNGQDNIAVTFCPLCGTAIVFDRGSTTFGVSGSLIESNMIMYDRASETLWQQSTGKSLAGERFGEQLELVQFQLLTMADVRSKYPGAQVLSDNTGHTRNYAQNPYSGYETSDDFVFAPSDFDDSRPPKEIMAVFWVGDTSVSTPWLELPDGQAITETINGQTVSILRDDGELTVTINGEVTPHYFEMWFSWSVQHGTGGQVIEV